MGLPGILSTRPHRLIFLAVGDACLYAATLKYGDPVENWTAEMQYVYAAFAWMTIWTLIKLIMDHGFVPPEDPNTPKEGEAAAAAATEGEAKAVEGKAGAEKKAD
jgi:hypothetical protein